MDASQNVATGSTNNLRGVDVDIKSYTDFLFSIL